MADNTEKGFLEVLSRGGDEALLPIVDRGAELFAKVVRDTPLAKGLIRMLNPGALVMAKHIGPIAVSGAIGTMLPDSLFKSPQRASLVKGGLSRFVTKLADTLGPDGNLDGDAVEQAASSVLDEQYVFAEQTRLVHVVGCPEIKGKRSKVTLGMILDREYSVADCCFKDMQNRINKPAEAESNKPADGPIRGIADVIDLLEDDFEQSLLLGWYNGLTDDEQVQVSADLDLASEGRLLVRGIKQGLSNDALLRLIKNQSSRVAVKRDLVEAGALIKSAATSVGTCVADQAGKAWDATATAAEDAAGSLVDPLEQLHQAVQNPQPAAKRGFFKKLWLAISKI